MNNKTLGGMLVVLLLTSGAQAQSIRNAVPDVGAAVATVVRGPPDQLAERVDGRTNESCNVYNMLKLTLDNYNRT